MSACSCVCVCVCEGCHAAVTRDTLRSSTAISCLQTAVPVTVPHSPHFFAHVSLASPAVHCEMESTRVSRRVHEASGTRPLEPTEGEKRLGGRGTGFRENEENVFEVLKVEEGLRWK